MEADWLRSRLESGHSIESIAREADKAPSTVAYWVKKHGLTSRYTARHAARGAIGRDVLEELMAEGLTIRAMAERLDRSYSTVRHWLARHALATPRSVRLAETAPARTTGAETVTASCPVHGFTMFIRRGNHGFRCRQCRMDAVDRRRKEIKRILVAEAGGACVICGYERSVQALQFHHLDPAQKSFSLAAGGLTRSLQRARAEAAKCVLLCANCHAEVEGGLATIAPTAAGRLPS
jgi:DNA-binding transcriptional ArsR family regulator